MKPLYLFVLALFVFQGCKKAGISDVEKKYFEIWRSEMMANNAMDPEYFNGHIRMKKVETYTLQDGTGNQYFKIYYRFKIDFAEVDLSDQFIIWKSNSDPLFPDYYLPRDIFLGQKDIHSALITRTNYSEMNTIVPSKKLYFKNKSAAQSAIHEVEKKMKFSGYELWGDSRAGSKTGHLIMTFNKTISLENNNCLQGEIDLITGEIEVSPTNCWWD